MNRRSALLPLAVLLAGCVPMQRAPEKKPINAYLADSRDLVNVRRVMVLPFSLGPGVGGDTERVRKAYVAELSKLRRFEIVPLPTSAEEGSVINNSLMEGRMSSDAMVTLCRRFHLDGVIVAVITAWRPYVPAHLGLRTQMISVHSGSTVWAVDAIYDCNDRSTLSDLRHYGKFSQATEGSVHGWEINTIAPTRFATFVSHRVVGTWRED